MEPKEKTSLNEEQPQVTESGQQPQEEVKDNTQEQQAAEESQEEEEKAEENELQKVREEAEELKDKYLRLSAEFDNYRKRTMKEKAELILNGSEKSLSSVLPIVDDFERALKNMDTANDVNAVKEGVQLIYNKFISVLEKNGVKAELLMPDGSVRNGLVERSILDEDNRTVQLERVGFAVVEKKDADKVTLVYAHR